MKTERLIRKLKGGLFIFSLVLLVFSCYYDDDSILQPDLPDPGAEISFSLNVMPIFNANCNGSGCHNSQGPSPDLSPGNAYSSLFNENMIDIDNPEASELIIRMKDSQNPMPTNGLLPSAQVNVVLEWINQGALDN